MLSDRLGCSAWLRSDTCPSYSARRVGCDGDGCDSLPSPQTCEGRERREPREPLGAALPSGPFQDPSSGSPTRIGLTYSQRHRKPYPSVACRTGRVHHCMVELPRAQTVYDYSTKGRRRQSCISVSYSRRSIHDRTHRLQSRQERSGQASARNHMGDQDMIYVAAVVWAGREARLCGDYL